jgi:hypothetical protein
VAFTFEGIDGAAEIDRDELTVTAQAKETVDLSDITSEFTLSTGATATVDGTPQVSGTTANDFNDPVTYTVTSGDGETTLDWTVTIIKPLPEGKVLYSYNPPAGYYFVVKYTDEDGEVKELAYGYGDGAFSEMDGEYIYYHQKEPYRHYGTLADNRSGWSDMSRIDQNDGPAGRTTAAQNQYYIDNVWSRPLYWFNLYLCSLEASRQGETDMFPAVWDEEDDIYRLAEWETDLQDYDATEYYTGSEKLNGVECNVFSGYGSVSQKRTFWVDKENGLTLKYSVEQQSGETQTWEITTYQLTAPDWDELHLRPQDGDEVVEP